MRKLIYILSSTFLVWSCSLTKDLSERDQQLNELTALLKASEANRSNDIRQFKDIVHELKVDMKKLDAKFSSLLDQNSSATLEMRDEVRKEIDKIADQMGSVSMKVKSLSSRLEVQAKRQPNTTSGVSSAEKKHKPAIKTYVQPKIEPEIKHSVKKTKRPAQSPTIKKAEPVIEKPSTEEGKSDQTKSSKLQIEE